MPLEVAPHEAIGGDADVERRVRGIVGDRGPVLLREREDAENPSDATAPSW